MMSLRKLAGFEQKDAKLASPFGRDWAIKLFGQETFDALPKYQDGPDAGKPKGWIIWRRCIARGYSSTFNAGFNEGQHADAWIGESRQTTREDAMSGLWLGRVQPLAASWSAGLFFDVGRERYRETRDWFARKWAAERAEIEAATTWADAGCVL